MNKKSMVSIMTVVLLAGALSGCGSSKGDTEVTAGKNQRLAYAMVTSMNGNEMTYQEVDESMVNRSTSTKRNSTNSSDTEQSTDSQGQNDRQMPQGGGPDMNSSEMPQGGPPDMNSSEMPQMDATEKPSMNKESEKAVTVKIPVGVTVHTTSDTNTTFSRIRSGDILKILFETDDDGKEVIVGIWMVK